MSGALLVKPSMEHLDIFPDIYKLGETYVPVSWNLSDLNETFDTILSNYNLYKQIASNGQESYKRVIDDPNKFIDAVKYVIK